MRKLLAKLAPLAIVIGLAFGGVLGGSAIAAPGDWNTCNSSIPADPSWHACVTHSGVFGGAHVNVRGTHSWSNFHWYASFYRDDGVFLGNWGPFGPVTYNGGNYDSRYEGIAPATTAQIVYVVHNNCGCGTNDQYWVK